MALTLVFSRVPEGQRQRQVAAQLAATSEKNESLDGLLGAYRGQQFVGAAFAQIQTGKTASVWPPQLVPGEPPSTAASLLDAVLRFLEPREVRMAQALLETDAQAEELLLCQGGFTRLSDLFYLASPSSEFPTSPPDCPLQFETYGPANHRRLASIVEATYQQTLDCPNLNGVRNIEDVLAGYKASGIVDYSRWLIVRKDDADVGCLLLSDFPEYDNWELVYMGIVPSARGHGLGFEIVRYAQWRAYQAGRSRLVLAVDVANKPAIEMYAAAGFQVWDRRAVCLKVFA